MANQHTKRKELLKHTQRAENKKITKIVEKLSTDGCVPPTVEQLQTAINNLGAQVDKISGLLSDVLGSIQGTINILSLPAAYLEGLTQDRSQRTQPFDAKHSANEHIRAAMVDIKAIVSIGNTKHAEAIGIKNDTQGVQSVTKTV